MSDLRYDLLGDTALDDPYPLYDELRASAPVYRDRRFFGCILTRYEDVVAVLKDARVSSRRPTADERVPRSLGAIADEVRELRAFQSRWMLCLDPPQHTRLRALVNSSFTAAAVAGMRGRVQSLVDELLQPFVDGARFEDMVRTRRAEPRADLLSALIAAEENGRCLDDAELIAMCVLLLFAGHETTTHLIGNGVLALLNWPAQFERLRVEPGRVPEAVEECLRFDSPVHATGRRATADIEIRGCRVRAGEFLTPVLGAANRDPAVFEEPNRLDISRTQNRHLAFALGGHFCLGAPLARLEGQTALGSIVAAFRHLEPAGELIRRKNFYMRGLESLPLVGKPA